MKKTLIITLIIGACILLISKVAWGAVVDHINAGFVTSTPSTDPAGTGVSENKVAWTSKSTTPIGATFVTEIGFWMDNTATATTTRVGIYNDNGLAYPNYRPTTLIASSTFTTTGSAGWQKISGLNIPITASTTYWIANYTLGTMTANYSADAANAIVEDANAGGLLDTFTVQSFTDGRIGAIYALTSSTTPAVTSTYSHPTINAGKLMIGVAGGHLTIR